MTESREHRLRTGGFGFFGAITASQSHQLNNVLATINELAGLLGDILANAERGAALDLARFARPIERIAAQVKRGQTYVGQLNSFAHTVDETDITFELNDAVQAIVTLCERFGKLRRVELEVELADPSPEVEGCPFDVQHLLYRCIDVGLRASSQSDTLRLQIEPADDGALVTLRSGAAPEDLTEVQSRSELLELLATDLGVTLELELGADRPLALVARLPRILGKPVMVTGGEP